jgi:hypothetical protein
MTDGEMTAAEVARLGGEARRDSMTPEERSEQARRAVEARWEKAGKLKDRVANATHGSPDRPLRIGDIEIPCYVLDDERRVIVQAGVLKGMGMAQGTGRLGEGDRLTKFATGKSLKPFISNDLLEMIKNPVRFRVPSGGALAYGYEATILADLCDAILEARKQGCLHHQQAHIATQCEILVRAFTKTGIIALVDEATGFQDVRARDALAKILEQFIAKELRPYLPIFPIDWFRELCRLRGIPFRENMRLPPYFGKLVNNLVYCRLAPGVLAELQRKNPVMENGRRKNKNHQWLTRNVGDRHLIQLLGSELTLMRMSENATGFKELVDKFHPPYKELPLFDWAESENRQD